jgi:replicative DNA helicase
VNELLEHLDNVQPQAGNAVKATCPFCGGRGFWLQPLGYSCHDCEAKGSIERLRDHLMPTPASDIVSILSRNFLDEFARQQSTPIDAIRTPLGSWNDVCKDDGGSVGIAKGWFVVIGGNPKFGKSILALNLAATAMTQGESVGFVTLEMSARQLAVRFYAMATGFDVTELEKSGFSDENFERVKAALDPEGLMLQGADFYVNTTPLTQLAEVLAAMEAMRNQTPPVRFFVVDYLQLVGLGDEESINRQVSEVTTHLRHFALRQQVTVIALSQFNRATSRDYSQPPRAQGLHGGMIVEASADQVVLLDHSRYTKDVQRPHLACSFLIVDLNRHGPAGTIPIEWNYQTLRIREGDPHEESRWAFD